MGLCVHQLEGGGRAEDEQAVTVEEDEVADHVWKRGRTGGRSEKAGVGEVVT